MRVRSRIVCVLGIGCVCARALLTIVQSHHTGTMVFQEAFRVIGSTEVKVPDEHHLHTQNMRTRP